jgi:hypothetical protein
METEGRNIDTDDWEINVTAFGGLAISAAMGALPQGSGPTVHRERATAGRPCSPFSIVAAIPTCQGSAREAVKRPGGMRSL